MCGGLVKSPRRWWCGEECVEKRRLETLTAREMIEERDHGVCALCGLDTERLLKHHRRAWDLLCHLRWRTRMGALHREDYSSAQAVLDRWLARRIGRDPGKRGSRYSFWDADHAVPLIEGGEHTRENLRTLCIWCHRDETAKLAGRRADGRRKQTRLFD